MLFGLLATHVDAHFGDYGLRILHFNAVDAREVHARDAVQLSAKVKPDRCPRASQKPRLRQLPN